MHNPIIQCDGSQQKDQKKVENDKKQQQKIPNRGPWAPAQIKDDACSFQTQTFLIRFTEEEIELNDICFFKCEIDAYPSYDNEDFYVVCELKCADLTTFGTAKNTNEDESEESIFKTIAVHESRLNNVVNGIHEYVGITFDEQHFCVAHASFHSTLYDFRFRLSEYQMNIMSGSQQKQQYSRISNKENSRQSCNRVPVLLQPKNFTEFLNKVTKRFKSDEVNNFYSYYVNGLKEEFQNLKQVLSTIMSKVVPSNIIKEKQLPTEKDFPVLEQSPYLKRKEGPKHKQNLSTYMVTEAPLNQNANFVNIVTQAGDTNEIQQHNIKISDSYDLQNIQEQEKLACDIQLEINNLSGSLYQMQKILTEYIQKASFSIIQYFGIEFHQKMRERWGESIFRNYLQIHDVTINTEPDAGKNHKFIAEKMRKQAHYRELEGFNIENLNMFPSFDEHPILFEDIFTKQNPKQQQQCIGQVQKSQINKGQGSVHVFVLCHGFQGNSFDMRHFKNNLALIHPQCLFLCSKANEDYTDQDIGQMGKRLATEVKCFINDWCPNNTLGRISFIGHSLGGVIIRAGLPYLQEFSSKMYTFFTLSSPHLGYMYNSSKVVDAGIWILQRMRKSKCLQQLSMNDADEIENTFLYNLAKAPGLNWFENIGLVSSFQDQYVALNLQEYRNFTPGTFDSKKGQKYQQMVDNLLSQIKSDKVHRIDVNFNIKELTIDNAIGRTAHILFLESDPLQKMFVYCFDHLFQ